MRGFAVHLCGADQYERLDEVVSFVGEDSSGSFGILPGHDRFMTVLVFGLARLRRDDGRWEYLGVPGGVLYFHDDALHLSTRRYLRDADPARIVDELTGGLLREEHALAEMRGKLRGLEHEMLRQMVDLQRS